MPHYWLTVNHRDYVGNPNFPAYGRYGADLIPNSPEEVILGHVEVARRMDWWEYADQDGNILIRLYDFRANLANQVRAASDARWDAVQAQATAWETVDPRLVYRERVRRAEAQRVIEMEPDAFNALTIDELRQRFPVLAASLITTMNGDVSLTHANLRGISSNMFFVENTLRPVMAEIERISAQAISDLYFLTTKEEMQARFDAIVWPIAPRPINA